MPKGYRFKEYEVLRVLGHGGFGITYLAFDGNLEKPVAIKEYLPDTLAVRDSSESVVPKAASLAEEFQWGLDRFLDEAKTLARFQHHNLIQIHRFFRENGTAYIVMEYAEGETLGELLRREKTLTKDQLWRVMGPLLDGLKMVHDHKFMHRDIKPGNIIIRDDGTPVLIDFGAARQEVSSKSQLLTAIVTAKYAPLEQYSEDGNQGPWTDIYAMGAVAYRCLTGKLPPDSILRMPDDPYVPVGELATGHAPGPFLEAIDWALSVFARNRPQTIIEWKAALEAPEVKAAPKARKPAPKKPVPKKPAAKKPPASPKIPTPVLSNEKALQELVRKAKAGDAEARFELGLKYSLGEGVGQSYHEALECYRLAAEGGHRRAQSSLGIMYENGQGADQNTAEAIKWYRLAAAQGSRRAKYNLGVLYEKGRGVEKNPIEAYKWYLLADAESDHGQGSAAKLNLSERITAGQIAEAEGLAEAWLAGDDIEAKPVPMKAKPPPDPTPPPQDWKPTPLSWKPPLSGQASLGYELIELTRKANAGDSSAQFELGRKYDLGTDVEQDDFEAFKWYRLAAKQGGPAGQFNIGVMYATGRGVEQRHEQAFKWYSRAAEQGYMDAQFNLANLYFHGNGIAQSYAEAYYWYRQAADQGDAEAQFEVGAMFEHGRSVEKNYAEALRWYRMAADQNHPLGQFGLGVMYYYGQGVPQDDKESLRWYRLAAAQGQPAARLNIGVAYENGRGVKVNLVQAYKWYLLAEASGSEQAEVNKSNLGNGLTPAEISEARRLADDWLAGGKEKRAAGKGGSGFGW
ncbi:MAG: serine/threonine-protein kinase, partial [Sphingomonadales bacterium]